MSEFNPKNYLLDTFGKDRFENDFWHYDGIPGLYKFKDSHRNPPYEESFANVLNGRKIDEIIQEQNESIGFCNCVDLMGSGYVGSLKCLPSKTIGLRLRNIDELTKAAYGLNDTTRLNRSEQIAYMHINNPYRKLLEGNIFDDKNIYRVYSALDEEPITLLIIRPYGPFIDLEYSTNLPTINYALVKNYNYTKRLLLYIFKKYLELMHSEKCIILSQIPIYFLIEENAKKQLLQFLESLKCLGFKYDVSFNIENGNLPSFKLERV